MTSKEISCLDELKRRYSEYTDKYGLVSFEELNEKFDLEEIDSESDFLLRKIRRVISDRIANYIRFVEIILNPSNAPMFFFKLIKKLEDSDKVILNEIYENLGKFEIEIVALDLKYDESKEAEAIKKMYDVFSEVSVKLLDIIHKLGNGENKKVETKRSYFG